VDRPPGREPVRLPALRRRTAAPVAELARDGRLLMRSAVRWAVIVIACVVLTVAVTMLIGADDHPASRPVHWSDARLAAALSAQVVGVGATVTPADVGRILTQDCPYITDPIGLVQHQHAGTEAEANAVMSVLAQSGRC
jgi:hypothetical protein